MLHRAGDRPVDGLAEISGEFLADLANAHIGPPGGESRQIGAHRAGRRCDRHVVVVENDDEARIERAGIVERFEGHPGRHRAIADHRDHIAALAVEFGGDSHAETGRDRGGGMCCAEGVVFAFRPPGEAREPVFLAQGADAITPAGQDLVRIALVSDIEDQTVMRRVEDLVDCDRQFDDAEARAQVPPVRDTASTISARNSAASCGRSLSSIFFRSSG